MRDMAVEEDEASARDAASGFVGVIQNKFLKLSQQRVWTGPGEIATVRGGGNRKQ